MRSKTRVYHCNSDRVFCAHKFVMQDWVIDDIIKNYTSNLSMCLRIPMALAILCLQGSHWFGWWRVMNGHWAQCFLSLSSTSIIMHPARTQKRDVWPLSFLTWKVWSKCPTFFFNFCTSCAMQTGKRYRSRVFSTAFSCDIISCIIPLFTYIAQFWSGSTFNFFSFFYVIWRLCLQ